MVRQRHPVPGLQRLQHFAFGMRPSVVLQEDCSRGMQFRALCSSAAATFSSTSGEVAVTGRPVEVSSSRSSLLARIARTHRTNRRLSASTSALRICDGRREGISFLERIVACDETWAHSWGPELKRQSASWCGPDSTRPQKARRASADLKVMHITFVDRHGVLFDQAVPVGQRVDGDY